MPRTIKEIKPAVPALPTKKRVAAYARVSSGKDAMLHSLSAQVSHYSAYIQRHKGWAYVGVYADEALTGTKDNRSEFQRMLTDCRQGKIDIILTKSISRFARNTITMLNTVRELRALGVDVYFEKENVHSMSGDGELMLSILASFAQEESYSASENCKWRLRRQFAEGRPSSTTILGYKLVDGTLEVIPEEAETVRMIFADYLSGMGRNSILKKLVRGDYPTKRGGTWSESTIYNMLRNEKYAGDMLLQKSFVSNHIEKKKVINEGQLPMYFVEGSHQAIIDRDTFQKVQAETQRRAAKHTPVKRQEYPFTGKLICAVCGKHYRRKIANASSKYAKPVWMCATFNHLGKEACSSQQIPEALLEEALGDILPGQVSAIHIHPEGRLTILLANGEAREATWQNKSRRESWTDDMKQKAREHALERSHQ